MTLNQKTINLIIPLGNTCANATMIKMNGWRKYAFPFDWLLIDTKIINHCINDNFQTLLDKNYYIDGACVDNYGHAMYHPNLFMHKDVRKPEHYQYLERCIKRFYIALNSIEHNKLFTIYYRNHHATLTDDDMKEITSLVDTLHKHCKPDFNVLVIHNVSNVPKRDHTIVKLSDVVTILCLMTESCDHDVAFSNETDTQYFYDIVKSMYNFDIRSISNDDVILPQTYERWWFD